MGTAKATRKGKGIEQVKSANEKFLYSLMYSWLKTKFNKFIVNIGLFIKFKSRQLHHLDKSGRPKASFFISIISYLCAFLLVFCSFLS